MRTPWRSRRSSPSCRRVLTGSLASVLPAAAALALAFPAAADEYQYDSLGRLIRVTYDSGAVVQYSYDLAGNRTQVVVNTGVGNGAPVAVNDTASVAVSNFVDIPVLTNDSDPDSHPLIVTAVGTPTGGGTVAVLAGAQQVRYTAPATAGVKTFTYTISDGHGGTASASVTVTVTAPNRSPVAVNDTYEVETYTTVWLTVRDNDSDPDGDPLTITSVSGAGASIGPGGAYIVYVGGGLGTKTVSYTVSDGRGGTASATATIQMYRVFPGDL